MIWPRYLSKRLRLFITNYFGNLLDDIFLINPTVNSIYVNVNFCLKHVAFFCSKCMEPIYFLTVKEEADSKFPELILKGQLSHSCWQLLLTYHL